jgi:purine nucleosidase
MSTAKKKKESKEEINKESKTETKKALIFDCDPGIDDAIALILFSRLLKEKNEAKEREKEKEEEKNLQDTYIVATWGNVELKHTLRNSLFLRDFLGIEAKVVKGRETSITGEVIYAKKVHGEDGLRGASLKYKPERWKEDLNLNELKQELQNYEEIRIIATGPLSSVAEIIQDKNLREKIKKIVWMGGAFFHDGNITPHSEFNSYCDPVAVNFLFDFAKEKKCVVVVPLDATSKTLMKTEDLVKLSQTPKISEFLKSITEGIKTIELHDPLAVFSFFYENSVKTFISYSHVDTRSFRGKISSIITPNGFLKVVYDFDKEKFVETLKRSF